MSAKKNETHKVNNFEYQLEGEEEQANSVFNKMDTLYIGCIDKEKRKKVSEWTEEVSIMGKAMEFRLDSGAEMSVLTLKDFKSLKISQPLQKNKVTLIAYGNENFKIHPVGSITLDCTTKAGKTTNIEFQVIDVDSKPILGLDDCIKLQLIKRIQEISTTKEPLTLETVLKQFSNVFSDIDSRKTQYYVKSRNNTSYKSSKINPPNTTSKVKTKVGRSRKKKHRSPINEPTKWVSNLVY